MLILQLQAEHTETLFAGKQPLSHLEFKIFELNEIEVRRRLYSPFGSIPCSHNVIIPIYFDNWKGSSSFATEISYRVPLYCSWWKTLVIWLIRAPVWSLRVWSIDPAKTYKNLTVKTCCQSFYTLLFCWVKKATASTVIFDTIYWNNCNFHEYFVL